MAIWKNWTRIFSSTLMKQPVACRSIAPSWRAPIARRSTFERSIQTLSDAENRRGKPRSTQSSYSTSMVMPMLRQVRSAPAASTTSVMHRSQRRRGGDHLLTCRLRRVPLPRLCSREKHLRQTSCLRWTMKRMSRLRPQSARSKISWLLRMCHHNHHQLHRARPGATCRRVHSLSEALMSRFSQHHQEFPEDPGVQHHWHHPN